MADYGACRDCGEGLRGDRLAEVALCKSCRQTAREAGRNVAPYEQAIIDEHAASARGEHPAQKRRPRRPQKDEAK